MDTLTILFYGLIAHVMTDGGAQRAVFVNAPMHEARLIVAESSIIENRGFARDEQGAFVLEGEHVVIDGIPKGDAMFEASYLRNVPSLTRISDGTTLIPEIETASPSDAVSAYVDLGRGTFSAVETWGSQATFGRSRAMCVASTVAFRAPANGEVVFRTDSGKTLRIKSSTIVQLSNAPPLSASGNHFHMYMKLLRDATKIEEPVKAGSCGGGGRRRVTTHTPEIVCSNIQYP